jgi:hypothetical protein
MPVTRISTIVRGRAPSLVAAISLLALMLPTTTSIANAQAESREDRTDLALAQRANIAFRLKNENALPAKLQRSSYL